MNKKLLAVAVAGALALPGLALAQSSVTISGIIKGTVGQYSAGNYAGTGNKSETVVRDESSRILFLVREDLGGGLSAIGKFDLRAGIDAGAVANSGESYVGLSSNSMGTLTIGRHDLHYGNHASATAVHGGLQTSAVALFDVNGAGATPVAYRTRTPNAVRYGSPKFAGMFEVVAAYSSDAETDFKSTTRKGSAWTFSPHVYGSNWDVAYSYWSQKPDASTSKIRGDSIYGWYRWGGLKVGLAWNKSKTDTAGVTVSDRTAWGIPVHYQWGANNIYFDYYKAKADKAAAFAGTKTDAKFIGLTYGYDLSKRTTAAVSYTKITNSAGAKYGLFTQQQTVANGEDPRFIGMTLQHRF